MLGPLRVVLWESVFLEGVFDMSPTLWRVGRGIFVSRKICAHSFVLRSLVPLFVATRVSGH